VKSRVVPPLVIDVALMYAGIVGVVLVTALDGHVEHERLRVVTISVSVVSTAVGMWLYLRSVLRQFAAFRIAVDDLSFSCSPGIRDGCASDASRSTASPA
jgi:hypothetical protein